jgi:hypothetical protein
MDATADEAARAEDFLKWAVVHNGVSVGKRLENSVEVKFDAPCSYIRQTPDGRFECANYSERFVMCRLFPEFPTPNCPGFWFEDDGQEQVHP